MDTILLINYWVLWIKDGKQLRNICASIFNARFEDRQQAAANLGVRKALDWGSQDMQGFSRAISLVVTVIGVQIKKKRKINHHLINGVGRWSWQTTFQTTIHRIKVRDTSGNHWGRIRMLDLTRDVIAGCKSKKLNRELPPTSWLRLEIWPQWQHSCNPGSVTDKRSRITAMSPQAIHTNTQQSIKRNIATD